LSLVVAVFVPTGIVLAADSRTIIQTTQVKQEKSGTETVHTPLVLSDASFKLFALPNSGVGILTHGDAILKDLPVESYIKRFAEQNDRSSNDAQQMASLLHDYFRTSAPGSRALFIVAGYNDEGGIVCRTSTPSIRCNPMARAARTSTRRSRLQYGVLRGGDTAVVDRLITPESLPPFHLMPLPDAVDYARYLIETTILTLRFEPRFPSVGGPVDVLTISADSMRFMQRKGQTAAGQEMIRFVQRNRLNG